MNSIKERRAFEVPLRHIRYRGFLDQHIDRNIFFFGSYANEEIDFLSLCTDLIRDIRGSVIVFDIGANVGHHSMCLAKKSDIVHAFEPNPYCVSQFNDNLLLNDIKNVKVYNFALGKVDEEGELGSGLDGNNGSRSLTWSINKTANILVNVRNGDRVVTEIGAQRIDLLKIDVEGYEKNVLLGLSESLRKYRPIILIEILGGKEKGGFNDEDELRDALYPDHVLYRLGEERGPRLDAFSWVDCELIVVPVELDTGLRELTRKQAP